MTEPSAGVRKPAVAGKLYPGQPERLRGQIEGFLTAADGPDLGGRVAAVIAPHAGYVYSGPTAGYSFRSLPPLAGRTIFLLGPAHYVPVEGVAVTSHSAFETPLGRVPVATEVNAHLLASGAPFHVNDIAHSPEHSLEVELPFLQVLGGDDWQIVPLLFGRVDPEAVARILLPRLLADPAALLVISSDLSHFHPYAEAQRRDNDFLDAVCQSDLVRVSRGEACGRVPILVAMHIAQQMGWQAKVLDYRNSGDTGGDRQRVVGYGSVAFVTTAPESRQ